MVLTNTAPPTDAWAPPAIAGSREGRGLSHQQLGRLWGHQNGSTMGAGTVATGFPRKGGNLAPSKYGERWSKPHFKGSTLQELTACELEAMAISLEDFPIDTCYIEDVQLCSDFWRVHWLEEV